MTDKIQQARRAAFESYFSRMANSHLIDAKSAWQGFNAALDAVEIELPDMCRQVTIDDESIDIYWPDEVRAAIESTNLGIRVK